MNKAGDIPMGDTTYTIKVIAYDDKYTGPGSVHAAQRLISQDGVRILVGPIGSVPVLAMADATSPAPAGNIAARYRTPLPPCIT